MSRNWGGRPAHHSGEVKKAAIAVRTAPSIHEALKRASKETGRSITQEVEARLLVSFDRDAGQRSVETEKLLNRIAAEISTIENLTGKRWHSDRHTAGAVKEMFLLDAPNWLRNDAQVDEESAEALTAFLLVDDERSRQIQTLEELGLKIHTLNEFARAAEEVIDEPRESSADASTSRWREKIALDKLDLPTPMRDAARAGLVKLEALDLQVAQAWRDYRKKAEPNREAEAQGRAMYRELKKRRSVAVRMDEAQ